MKYLKSPIAGWIFASAIFFFASSPSSVDAQQQIGGSDRANAIGMLNTLVDNIKSNYYDPTFHGVDLDFVQAEAKTRMKNAQSFDELVVILAQVTLTLNDSHTTFYPPARAADIDYGWRVSMVGKDCFVTGVKPKSDAETKGLKVGDKVLLVNGFKPTREHLWQMYYRYYAIAPTSAVRFTVLSPGEEKPHTIDVATRISPTSKAVKIEDLENRIIRKGWDERKDRFVEFGDELLVWKMTTFSTSDQYIDEMMKKANARKSLILDLRGNGGGAVSILKRLVGYFTDKELKLGDEKKKKETKPILAKPRGGSPFKGNLIVLVDHDSGSASEIFARTVQLNKFGKVIGDKTAGAVMESIFFPMEIGAGSIIFYGASITVADVIMPDGASLEKTGVAPDETVLTTGRDLAEKKDPVLAYAAKQIGVQLTAEKAGTFFPIIWDK